jgi:hypothetical protein
MWRRAVEGTDKPVFSRGVEVGVIREYSDALAMFLAKGHRPKKYRERQEIRKTVTHRNVREVSRDRLIAIVEDGPKTEH